VTILETDEENSEVTILVSNYDDLSTDEPYELNLTITDATASSTEDDEESATAEFELATPTLEWDDSAEKVPAVEGATAMGETNLAPARTSTTRRKPKVDSSSLTPLKSPNDGQRQHLRSGIQSELSTMLTLSSRSPARTANSPEISRQGRLRPRRRRSA